eukprot:scaffold152935_cov34-Tisochrysis_lutea.AAC.4
MVQSAATERGPAWTSELNGLCVNQSSGVPSVGPRSSLPRRLPPRSPQPRRPRGGGRPSSWWPSHKRDVFP